MIKVKLDQNIAVIGDIWVRVDIQFKPVAPVNGVQEEIALSSLNNRLDYLSFELAKKTEKWIEESLEKDHD